MTTKVINIANDFSKYPSGRFREDSQFSGEEFRDAILIPALEKFEIVEIYFDGLRVCGASFLEEAFGGLVRSKKFVSQTLLSRLILKANSETYEYYKEMALSLIEDAST